jgi:hypothetical protein
MNLVRNQTGSTRNSTNPTHLFEVRLRRLQDRTGFRLSREQEVGSWTCLVRNGARQENGSGPTTSVTPATLQDNSDSCGRSLATG